MYIITHLFILFVFLVVTLMVNIPNINHDSGIKMKLYIFVSVFIFEIIIGISVVVYNECIIDLSKIFGSSLRTALVSVIGYSVYQDMIMNNNSFFHKLNNGFLKNITLSVIVIMFITINFILEIFLGYSLQSYNCKYPLRLQ